MPIKDLSDKIRLPRLGHIHLGIRDPDRGFPISTDYFVFPKDHSLTPTLTHLFGEKPKELRIVIPVEDDEVWANQYYRSYTLTRGLVCMGDGEQAARMVDVKTRELATNTTVTTALTPLECSGKDCPVFIAGKCKRVMQLRFLIPEVPGLGVWQIDTSSINSILNINATAAVIKRTFGRISMIPLLLTLELDPKGGKLENGTRSSIYVLNLRTKQTVKELAEATRQQDRALLLAAPIEYGDPADLWGDGEPEKVAPTEEPAKPVEPQAAVQNAEPVQAVSPAVTPPAPAKQSKVKPLADWDKVTQDKVKTWNDLLPVAYGLSGLQPPKLYKEFGGTCQTDMNIKPWDAFLTLKDRYYPKETAQVT